GAATGLAQGQHGLGVVLAGAAGFEQTRRAVVGELRHLERFQGRLACAAATAGRTEAGRILNIDLEALDLEAAGPRDFREVRVEGLAADWHGPSNDIHEGIERHDRTPFLKRLAGVQRGPARRHTMPNGPNREPPPMAHGPHGAAPWPPPPILLRR